jgi:hypothetical protein
LDIAKTRVMSETLNFLFRRAVKFWLAGQAVTLRSSIITCYYIRFNS